MLAETRQDVADLLIAADVKAVIYEGETITAPCAVVVPGQPYLNKASNRDDVAYGEVLANLDVLLVVTPAPAKTAAARIDALIEKAYAALKNDHHITGVTRPGTTLPIGGTKYFGAVLRVEQITEEP